MKACTEKGHDHKLKFLWHKFWSTFRIPGVYIGPYSNEGEVLPPPLPGLKPWHVSIPQPKPGG